MRSVRIFKFDPESGMSLVETLMAVFIVGIASSLIILTMPARPDPLQVEAGKLVQYAEMARSRALISGEWTGVIIAQDAYQQVIFRDGEWVSSSQRAHDLPSGVTIAPARAGSARANPTEALPALQFGPTGTALAETIIVERRTDELAITIRADGMISLEQGDG